MALITCPECKNKLSDSAAACPQCGYQLTPERIAEIRKKEEQSQKAAGIGCLSLIALVVILYVTGSLSSGRSGGNAPKAPEKITAWVMAQQFIKDRLKSPGTADFGGVFNYQDPESVVTDLGGGKFRVRAWVDAQNSFGGKIRNQFVCELKFVGNDKWQLTNL